MEILRQEGKLAVKRQEMEKLALRINGLVKSIRDCLDPTETDPAMQRADVAAELAVELSRLRTDFLALRAETAEIRQYLGRN